MKNQIHSDESITKIRQNTEQSPGVLKILAATQTIVKATRYVQKYVSKEERAEFFKFNRAYLNSKTCLKLEFSELNKKSEKIIIDFISY